VIIYGAMAQVVRIDAPYSVRLADPGCGCGSKGLRGAEMGSLRTWGLVAGGLAIGVLLAFLFRGTR